MKLFNNYITCGLRGRTGNMMFEIAHAYAKSLEFNRQLVVPLLEESHSHLRPNLFRKVNFTIETSLQDSNTKSVHAPFTYIDLNPSEDSPTAFFGYYQSEKYFSKYSENVKDLFSPTADFLNRAIQDFPFLKGSVVAAINVRRGDYLSMSEHHPVISLEYINEAYKYLPNHDYLMVLSDDMQWCKENIKFPNVIFVENYWDWEGIWLLSLCDHFIISNSTFSWWGAYLSRSENKVVIAPETWFGPEIKEDPKDICCEGWIKLPTYYDQGCIKPKKKIHKIVSVYQSDLPKEIVEYQKKVFDFFGIPIEQVVFEKGVSRHPEALLDYINSLQEWDSITFFDIDCVPIDKDCVDKALSIIEDDSSLYGNVQVYNGCGPYVGPGFMSFTRKFWEDSNYKNFNEGLYPDINGEAKRRDVAEIFSIENEKQGKKLVFAYPTKCLTRADWVYDGSSGGQTFSYGVGTEYESGTYHNYQIRIPERHELFIEYCKKILGEL